MEVKPQIQSPFLTRQSHTGPLTISCFYQQNFFVNCACWVETGYKIVSSGIKTLHAAAHISRLVFQLYKYTQTISTKFVFCTF